MHHRGIPVAWNGLTATVRRPGRQPDLVVIARADLSKDGLDDFSDDLEFLNLCDAGLTREPGETLH